MFDPASDFESVVDGLTSATLVRPGSSTTIALDGAIRHALKIREASSSKGRYASDDVVWHLGGGLPATPRPGDLIVDSGGTRWTILEAQQKTLGARWRCVARNIAARHGLNDYVDIERAAVDKTLDGAASLRWETWRTGLRARLQSKNAEVRTEGRNRRLTERFQILLEAELELGPNDRVRGSDGRLYAIESWRKADPIGVPFQIDAIRTEETP
jgi:hypothetical protein